MIKNSAAITDCSDIPPLKGQLIDNISLPDKKNAHSLDAADNVLLSYDDGTTKATAPIKLTPSGSDSATGIAVDKAGFYISAEKTAIAYGGTNHEPMYVITSDDMGKTWTQIGNSNASDARVLTGAGFSDNKTGLLCFRFETSQLNICSTQDGGKTWAKLDISVPKGFEEYYSATPLSPVFNGSKGELPIQLKNKNDQTKTIYFSSDDGGRSWTYAQN